MNLLLTVQKSSEIALYLLVLNLDSGPYFTRLADIKIENFYFRAKYIKNTERKKFLIFCNLKHYNISFWLQSTSLKFLVCKLHALKVENHEVNSPQIKILKDKNNYIV